MGLTVRQFKANRHSVGIDASVYFGRQPASRPAHQPCFGPARATAVLMYADNGSVDHLDGAVMGFREGLHDRVPDASHPPTNKPVVASRVRPKGLRQIAQWCSRPQYPEDAVEDTPVVDPRHAARLVGKERPDGSPLKVREFVSHDSRPRLGSLESCLSRWSQYRSAGPRWGGYRTCREHVNSDANDPKRKSQPLNPKLSIQQAKG